MLDLNPKVSEIKRLATLAVALAPRYRSNQVYNPPSDQEYAMILDLMRRIAPLVTEVISMLVEPPALDLSNHHACQDVVGMLVSLGAPRKNAEEAVRRAVASDCPRDAESLFRKAL